MAKPFDHDSLKVCTVEERSMQGTVEHNAGKTSTVMISDKILPKDNRKSFQPGAEEEFVYILAKHSEVAQKPCK